MFPQVELPTQEFGGLWQTLTSSERATLTLTSNGPVLGAPSGAYEDAVSRAVEAIRAWQTGDVLVLPWPVDVVDLR